MKGGGVGYNEFQIFVVDRIKCSIATIASTGS